MAINFNDTDLRTSSLVVLETPQELAQTIANKAAALVGKDDALKKDQANELFYDNVLNIVQRYHDELRALNGSLRTTYSDTDLQDGGKLAPNHPHFPADPVVWVNFPPKMLASQNGGPIVAQATHEIFNLGELNTAVTQIKTGYVDGANTTTLNAPYSGGTTLNLVSSPFTPGQRLTVFGGGASALVELVSVTVVPPVVLPLPLPGYTAATVIVLAAPSGTIPMGGTVQNFFSGFTNTQRESGVVTPYTEIFNYYKSIIVSEKDLVKGFLNNQLTALNANDVSGAEAGDVTTAKTDVQDALNFIATWEGLPLTGVGSQYGNTGIANLETVITDRGSQAPARASAVNGFLGSVSQAGNGDYTGSGQYEKLTKWINLRINKSSGTLRVWYDFDLIITFIDSSIAVITARKQEYDTYMIVKRITTAPSNVAVIELEDVTSLSVSDSVKIIDDDQPSIVRVILNITGNIVTLDGIVPNTYLLDKNARLIKLL